MHLSKKQPHLQIQAELYKMIDILNRSQFLTQQLFTETGTITQLWNTIYRTAGKNQKAKRFQLCSTITTLCFQNKSDSRSTRTGKATKSAICSSIIEISNSNNITRRDFTGEHLSEKVKNQISLRQRRRIQE